MTDIENINRRVYGASHLTFREDHLNEVPRQIIWDLLKYIKTQTSSRAYIGIQWKIRELASIHNVGKVPRLSNINYTMRMMVTEGYLSSNEYKTVVKYTTSKESRASSGIFQVAVMLSGREMNGCDYDCYYCPDQPGMPRSYVREGPSARRAEEWDQKCVPQIHSRLTSYSINGHTPDKLEIIVLGGTWSSFPMEYRKQFINEVFYAVNTFYDDKKAPREMLSLKEEQEINTSSPGKVRIVGLTVETRPDCVTPDEIESMLEFGVTRVQLGVQHTDNRILKKINRKCTIEDVKAGIKLLKDSGFKIICHYMPNLPDSTPEMDRDMLSQALEDPDLDCDDLKIYPTMVTTTSERDRDEVFSVLEKWYIDGKYVPYSQEELHEVLVEFMSNPMLRSKRVSRLFRDIPRHNTIAGCEKPHMRELIMQDLNSRGLKCECIRTREVRNAEINPDENEVVVHHRVCSEGDEYFIELINGDLILGFVRLRLPRGDFTQKYSSMPEYAFIRELHVYSHVNSTISEIENADSRQHRGYGTMLLQRAEAICYQKGYYAIAIIAGVGVRDYYAEKHGYKLEKNYMVKHTRQKSAGEQVDVILNTAALCEMLYYMITSLFRWVTN
jgi:ELP3 family radical SAM enzyme/protein acetyltransferase